MISNGISQIFFASVPLAPHPTYKAPVWPPPALITAAHLVTCTCHWWQLSSQTAHIPLQLGRHTTAACSGHGSFRAHHRLGKGKTKQSTEPQAPTQHPPKGESSVKWRSHRCSWPSWVSPRSVKSFLQLIWADSNPQVEQHHTMLTLNRSS